MTLLVPVLLNLKEAKGKTFDDYCTFTLSGVQMKEQGQRKPNGKFDVVGVRTSHIYHAMAVINLESDRIHLYFPNTSPVSHPVVVNNQEHADEEIVVRSSKTSWKVGDLVSRKLLFIYRRMTDDENSRAVRHTSTFSFDPVRHPHAAELDLFLPKTCQMCIQQISSLKNHFSAERQEKEQNEEEDDEDGEPTAGYSKLQDVLLVAGRAFDLLADTEKKQGMSVYCSILSNTGLLHAHGGFFDLSLPKIEEYYRIRCEVEKQDWSKFGWIEVALGNTRKDSIANDLDDFKPAAMINQDVERCHTLLGRFDEAERRLRLARAEFEGSKNLGQLA
ncbi:hypothetical protein B0H63DRAFT_526476 [Podospora didyma]|uniref:Uncharacterized protein n=1 Tax=Podospora didyma TaxID=330526 RepID=A0AAE0KE87_9PEZI|nr:hypothetical protein B0H63DRAFT_526476 [Podospora didyma]